MLVPLFIRSLASDIYTFQAGRAISPAVAIIAMDRPFMALEISLEVESLVTLPATIATEVFPIVVRSPLSGCAKVELAIWTGKFGREGIYNIYG